MKRIKKLLAVLLAVVMVASMGSMSVMADGTTYTITISNSTEGYAYAAYQIFKGDLSDSTLSNVDWGTGVDSTKTSELITALKKITSAGTIGDEESADSPFFSCTNAASVAEVLAKYSTDNVVVQAFAQVVSNYLTTGSDYIYTTSTLTEGDGYQISGLEAGYYFVKATAVPKDSDNNETAAYTRYILEVVKDVTITEKASVPTITKTVDDQDVYIGQTVTYTLTATMPSTYADYDTYKLVFHDVLSEGLTFNNDVAVTVYANSSAETGTVVATSDYSVAYTSGENQNDECTFEVSIADTNSLKDASGTDITVTKDAVIKVTYTAKVNSAATTASTGNINEASLEYSNNPNSGGSGSTGTTTTEEVPVFTFELDLTKVDGTDNTKNLEGAEFYLQDSDSNYLTVSGSDGNYTVTGWTADSNNKSTLVSPTGGKITIKGLASGTYTLTETKAPEGYNSLSSPVTIVITATYTDSDSDGTNESVSSLSITIDGSSGSGSADTGIVSGNIENNAGSVIPSTGGIGTTIFYVVGAILALGAAVILVTRRRMQNRA